MIKVNLLRSRAVVGKEPVAAAAVSAAPSAAQAEAMADFSLDAGFNTFEYSQFGQILKVLLLIGFVTPLIVFEKMRGDGDKALVNAKSVEVQTIQDIKFQKEEEVARYVDLEKKKEVFLLRDAELRSVKGDRLIAVQSVDAIQTAVPVDVWLTNMVFADGIIQINGKTLVDTGLDIFVKSLMTVKGFSNINVPKDIKVKSESGRTINEFLITLKASEDIGASEKEGI